MATYLELANHDLQQTLRANQFAGTVLDTNFGVGSIWRRTGLNTYVEVYRCTGAGKPVNIGDADPMEVWVCAEDVPLAKRVAVMPYTSFVARLVDTINHVSGLTQPKRRTRR